MKEKKTIWRSAVLVAAMIAFTIACEQAEPAPSELVSPELCNKDVIKNCTGTITCNGCDCVCNGSDNDN